MRYLRKVATYKVRSEGGETLFVDEFEAACPKAGTAHAETDRKLMLRDGERVSREPDGTLHRKSNGEQLVILDTH